MSIKPDKYWIAVYILAAIAVFVILYCIFIFGYKVLAHNRTPLPPQTKVVQTISATLTAYSLPGYTADGTAVAWTVAACPYELPFGTKFRIKNFYEHVTFTCHDRSAYYSGLFDIWVEDIRGAQDIGRRSVTIEILK